jgi:hypothetical protein
MPAGGYEVVTNDCAQVNQNLVLFAPTVVFSGFPIWFLGGGPQAAFQGKSPSYARPVRTYHAQLSPPQMTRNSNRIITIKRIRLIPPPP